MTEEERHHLQYGIGWVGPINELYWQYMALLINRPLTADDREYVRREILGYRPEWAAELRHRGA